MNISKPTERERDIAIDNILSAGLSKPDGIWHFCSKMYRSLGLKFIFFDISQAIIMAVAVTVAFILMYPLSSQQNMYSLLYVISPLFFISIVCFTEFIERNDRIYELKMTCKYTVQQIIVFRVLCYSLISILLCIFISGGIPVTYNFLRAVSITLSALMICALFTIYVMRRLKGRWVYLISPVVWAVIVFLPVLIFGEKWELFLSQIPIGIAAAVAIIGFYLYLREIKKLINTNKLEVPYYVGN